MQRVILSLLLLLVSVEAENLEMLSIDGYLRGSYQSHDVKNDKVYKDDALGGKLHIETKKVSGLSMGSSIYSSNALFYDDNKGLVPLRGENAKSYAILGEAYLKAEFSKSSLTLGRQEIDTPFAQMDDIGMVPNTFEALVFETTIFENSSFFMAHLSKMAGVDAEVVNEFTSLNASRGVQVAGATYEGINNLSLTAWYYNMSDSEIEQITFFEADYEKSFASMSYALGLQYANQNYKEAVSANVYGATLSGTFEDLGLTFSGAYTKVEGNAASSGFGGGPFYSNSEYLILDNAGKDGNALWYGLEYVPKSKILEGLTVGLGKVTLKNAQGLSATEVDLVTSYEFNNAIEVHAIFSNLKAANVGEDDAKHLRVFANYNF